jgi:hypothetical protein
VLYEMLTTRRPMHRGASAPSASNSHVPPELDQLVLKAVSPNPESRQQSAATLAAELRSLTPIIDAREDAAAESAVQPASRPMSATLIVAVIAIAVLAALVVWLTRS